MNQSKNKYHTSSSSWHHINVNVIAVNTLHHFLSRRAQERHRQMRAPIAIGDNMLNRREGNIWHLAAARRTKIGAPGAVVIQRRSVMSQTAAR